MRRRGLALRRRYGRSAAGEGAIVLSFKFHDDGQLHDAIAENDGKRTLKYGDVSPLGKPGYESQFWNYAEGSGKISNDFEGGYDTFDTGGVGFEDGSVLDDPSSITIQVNGAPRVLPGLNGDDFVYDLTVTVPRSARWSEVPR